ncbi:glycosyltransferase [Ekhidna sp.]|uniref:glycosyltransferase n=1 Tax=Ekhidna sp. TaxID=2608089 RepID=UPI003C7BC84F
MNILFIGYWGANEGLSQATINPHLEILLDFKEVEKVIYVSLERNKSNSFNVPSSIKLDHIPLKSDNYRIRLFNKIFEQIQHSRQLRDIVKLYDVDLVIARSSLAGNFASYIHKKSGIPFVVESFEPHADYMLELGIWKRWGLSYLYQKRMERIQKKNALHIYPVSNNYKMKLIEEGVKPSKITTLPCAVDLNKFCFDKNARSELRDRLYIPSNAITGIYVGKFGGIYFSLQRAFKLFREFYKNIDQFYLILLTPEDSTPILDEARRVGIPTDKIKIDCVQHDQVSSYLSASDFAFSLHFPSDSMKFVSPIKNGEYWACGLPSVISEGIGDDSEIIKNSGCGIVLRNGEVPKNGYKELMKLIASSDKDQVVELARNFRSFSNSQVAYRQLIDIYTLK